jgi:hypothetical protein
MTVATAQDGQTNMSSHKSEKVLWTPKDTSNCELTKFREKINAEYGLRLGMKKQESDNFDMRAYSTETSFCS